MAVFVLQLIPIVGVIFVMMGSMFWGVFTINLAVVAVVLDCRIGRLPNITRLAWPERPADNSATDFVAEVLSLQAAPAGQQYPQ